MFILKARLFSLRTRNLTCLRCFVNPARALIDAFFDERDRWFLWLPVFMLVGICLYFAVSWEPSTLWLMLSPVLAFITFKARRWPQSLPSFAIILTICLGFNAAQLETWRLSTPLLDAPLKDASITGTLMRAEAVPDGSRITIKNPWIRGIPSEERPHFVRIKLKTAYKDLPEAGVRINIWGPLWPPSDPVAPHGYDFRKHAYYAQIGGSGASYVAPRVRTSKKKLPFFWDRFLVAFEKGRRALTLMAHERLSDPLKDMTATLLSGSQAGIDRDIMRDMRLSGLSHLLSISGIHVSMMALLIYVPLRFILALFPWLALRFPIKKGAAFAAIIATSFYTILVGADAPTVRSALMTGIVFFAIISDRKAMSLRLVALAAMAIMLITPSASMGPSFQMSFAAVLTMIAAFEKSINHSLKEGVEIQLPNWFQGAWRSFRAIVLTSLVATAATAPFTMYHFQTFSFYGVVANMIAIPFTSFWIMPCLLMTYITAPFGAAGWFIDGAGWGVGLVIDLAHMVAAWPLSHIPFPPMPAWILIVMTLGGLWLCLWKRRWRFVGALPLLLCLLYPLFYNAPTVFVANEDLAMAVKLEDGRFIVLGKKKSNFTTSQWRQQVGWPDTVYVPTFGEISFGEELTCDVEHCLYKRGNTSIAFLAPPEKKAKRKRPVSVCPKADIIIGFVGLSHCKSAVVIDARALLIKGAHSISFKEDKPVISYVRVRKETRPWSVR